MTSTADSTAFQFSAHALPAADRMPIWRETFGRKVLRIDSEPLPDVPFFGELSLRALPGLRAVMGALGGSYDRRTPELVAGDNDDLGLAVNVAGTFIVSQRGREQTLGAGDAYIMSCGDTGTFIRPEPGWIVGLRVPRTALAALVANVDDTVIRPMSRDNEALGLLMGYAGTLNDAAAMATAELRHEIVAHIHDLIAMTIGATRDATAMAQGRGVRAARLRAIKTDIRKNLANPELSIGSIARRHRLTPRYIQILFGSEGVTYSDFVLGQRLSSIHRALSAPRSVTSKISAIVFAGGFSDLSYFNKCFRRLYGETPSDARARSRDLDNLQ
jgi:AraC-like DNA-binding protein